MNSLQHHSDTNSKQTKKVYFQYIFFTILANVKFQKDCGAVPHQYYLFNENNEILVHFSSMKNCNCHGEARSITPTSNTRSVNVDKGQMKLTDATTQTLSTGDIVITKIIFEDEHEKAKEKVLTSSPKRNNS